MAPRVPAVTLVEVAGDHQGTPGGDGAQDLTGMTLPLGGIEAEVHAGHHERLATGRAHPSHGIPAPALQRSHG